MSNPSGIVALLTKIGDGKIKLQALGAGYFSATETLKDCKISFATEPGTALRMERKELIGVVLWLQKSDVDAATGSKPL